MLANDTYAYASSRMLRRIGDLAPNIKPLTRPDSEPNRSGKFGGDAKWKTTAAVRRWPGVCLVRTIARAQYPRRARQS